MSAIAPRSRTKTDYVKESAGKTFWQRLLTPPPPATLWMRGAWSFWTTPPIVLFPLLLPVFEPSSIPGLLHEYWDTYLLFFGLPFALGCFCWWQARRLRARESQ
jgi:hypothetical protein